MGTLDTPEQAADMAAIRARWPRKVFESLDDCGGDDAVQVERVAHQGVAQYLATFKVDPDTHRGYGTGVSESIADLYAMKRGYEELLRERSEFPYWTQRP